MSEKRKNMLAAGLIAAGILSMALGIWRGEMAEVLRKATAICLECMGIG